MSPSFVWLSRPTFSPTHPLTKEVISQQRKLSPLDIVWLDLPFQGFGIITEIHLKCCWKNVNLHAVLHGPKSCQIWFCFSFLQHLLSPTLSLCPLFPPLLSQLPSLLYHSQFHSPSHFVCPSHFKEKKSLVPSQMCSFQHFNKLRGKALKLIRPNTLWLRHVGWIMDYY